MNNQEEKVTNIRIILYLALVFGFVFLVGILAFVLKEQRESIYTFLIAIFTAVPVAATAITRIITKDKSSWHIDFRVWKNIKLWVFSAFMPAVAIFFGTVIFYLIFPNDLDFSATYITENFTAFGVPESISFNFGSLILFGVILIMISALNIFLQFVELGEEIGWRGYLLPLLCFKMSKRKAVLVNGVLWGIAHAPLIFYGFNYGLDYVGAPYLGIIMMIIVCVVLGIWTSYVTLKSNNCMYAAIVHGSVNIIGEAGIWLSLSTKSTLLGPNPTGIIGMSILIIISIILFTKLKEN